MRRKVSLWIFLLLTWIFIGLMVLFGWSVWHISNGGTRFGVQSKIIISIAKFPSLVKEIFVHLPQGFQLLDDKYPNLKSIRVRHTISDDGYILLSSYDKRYKQSAVNLLRLSDSKILHTWILNFDQLTNWHVSLDGYRKKEFRMIHPLLLEDGSIIFQNTNGPLISLDLHSNITWVLKGKFNHSIELDADGNIWVPNIIDSSIVKPFILKLLEDDAIGKSFNKR